MVSITIFSIYLPFGRNTYRKKGIIILKLYNYNEVKYLVSKGVKFGENGISATRAKNRRAKTWYLTESRRNMSLLNNFRKHSIIESH